MDFFFIFSNNNKVASFSSFIHARVSSFAQLSFGFFTHISAPKKFFSRVFLCCVFDMLQMEISYFCFLLCFLALVVSNKSLRILRSCIVLTMLHIGPCWGLVMPRLSRLLPPFLNHFDPPHGG